MKAFVHEAVHLLGGRVEEAPSRTLRIRAPRGSEAAEWLQGAEELQVALDRKTAPAGVPVLAPGSPLLDDLTEALAGPGRSRHGARPARTSFSRPEARDRLRVHTGRLTRFTARKGWRATARLWVKAAVRADDVHEHLLAVEVSENGPARVLDRLTHPPQDVQWREAPPISRPRFEALVERGMKRAEQEAVRLSEEAVRENLERLYQTLDRLDRYYRQLREEALSAGRERAAAGARAEHARRKADEIEAARVHAHVELVSVETVSSPVKQLQWTLEGPETKRIVSADFDLVEGDVLGEIRCEVCDHPTAELGLGPDGSLACPACTAHCAVCEREMMGPDARAAFACAVTGEPVCDEHAAVCETCRVRIRSDRALRCEAGCTVCPACARTCPDCSQDTIWCPEHVHTNALGQSVCPSHVFFCHACRDPHPLSRVMPCASCGVTLCPACAATCAGCGRAFCPEHLIEGRCFPCRQEVKRWKSSFQRTLF